MRRFAYVLVVLALTAGAAGASTVSSGLRGKVYSLGGGACLQGADCGKRPLAGTTLVFSVAGRPVAKVVTGADGSYRVHLAAGTYAVRIGQAARSVTPNRALVHRGKMTPQQFVVAGPHIP